MRRRNRFSAENAGNAEKNVGLGNRNHGQPDPYRRAKQWDDWNKDRTPLSDRRRINWRWARPLSRMGAESEAIGGGDLRKVSGTPVRARRIFFRDNRGQRWRPVSIAF